MQPVLIGKLLWMGGNSLLLPVKRSVGDGIISKEELDV